MEKSIITVDRCPSRLPRCAKLEDLPSGFAFFGTVGNIDRWGGFYLKSRISLVYLADPSFTFDHPNTEVWIDYQVNLKITSTPVQ